MNCYVAEARDRMWELGISIHCTHNEVAPAQHEISPIFSLANLAADTNVLAMDVLRDLAFDHGFAILFHEKPFAGINGNGKHNNWGLNTDTGSTCSCREKPRTTTGVSSPLSPHCCAA